MADVDLGALKDALAATIAKAKADDPRELRRQLAEVNQRLAEIEQTNKLLERTASKRQPERIEVPVINKQEADTLAELDGKAVFLAAELRETADKLIEVSGRILAALQVARGEHPIRQAEPVGRSVPRIDPVPAEHKRPATANRPAPRPEHSAPNGGDATVTAPQLRILAALASFEAVGLADVAKSNVAVWADQSPSSSGFANNLGALRSRGLIAYPQGGRVALTDAGRAIAPPAEKITSLQDLHAGWQRRLSRPQWAIVQALINIYPDAIGRAALAESADQSPTSSGYANNLGALRSLGLIEYPSSGWVGATELLFPALPHGKL